MPKMFIILSLFLVMILSGCNKSVSFVPEFGHIESAVEANLSLARNTEQGLMNYAVAAWWGFNPDDSTAYLQAAIDSGADFLIIPQMPQPWVIGPVFLKSDQHIFFEPGVVVKAKKGVFLNNRDSLFSILNQDNITIEGRGATFLMNKEDYIEPPYPKGEWRHCLNIRGARNISISGLTLANSGGDGIYIGRGIDDPERIFCQDITVRNCRCLNNHRQGMSVISVENLLVENCDFIGTSGTKPMTGIDFEPNGPDEPLRGIVVRGCHIEHNAGGGVQFWLDNMTRNSGRLSAYIEGCTIKNNGLWSIQIHGLDKEDAPKGVINFNNNSISGIKLVWKHPHTNINFK